MALHIDINQQTKKGDRNQSSLSISCN